jgi:hypothetical protein
VAGRSSDDDAGVSLEVAISNLAPFVLSAYKALWRNELEVEILVTLGENGEVESAEKRETVRPNKGDTLARNQETA